MLKKNGNFRFLFLGRLITNFGDSLYAIATMYLIYELTKDAFYTGVAGGVIMIPSACSFLVGPLVDRWRLKSILVYTQIIEACIVSLIPMLYILDLLNVWLIIMIMFTASCIEQIVYPAQQAALPKLVSNEQLLSGNALMNFAYQGTDFIFMGLSGYILTKFGAINVFIFDVATFLIAAIFFRLIILENIAEPNTQKMSLKQAASNYIKELKEGQFYVLKTIIPKLIPPLITGNFIFGMVTAILPKFADHLSSTSYYGYLLLASTAAILLGSIIAPKLSKCPIGKISIILYSLSSIFWFISVCSSIPIFTIIFFGLSFIPVGINNVLMTSLIQNMVSESMLGRVFAWFSSAVVLFYPLGSFSGGLLSKYLSVTTVYTLGGVAFSIVALYWTIYPILRKLPSISEMEK